MKETPSDGVEIARPQGTVGPARWLSDPGPSLGAESGVPRDVLQATLATMLDDAIPDYCPNGLQVEGAAHVTRVVCGVTASLALVQAAASLKAQALLVHHGWFWRGEDPRALGPRRARMATVLAHDINLFAYHLPLDRHPEWGNNVQLARHLAWPEGRAQGRDGLLQVADWPAPTTVAALVQGVHKRLERAPLVLGPLTRPVRRVAWCTGAGQDFLQEAIALGADLMLSGEVNERTTHLAREAGVVYVAAGHHATERYGVQALGTELARRLPLEVMWVEDLNPV